VDPLALRPERGGKKNLKVATVLMDDQDERMIASSGEGKKKLVIVGGGWGVSLPPI
jgi:NADH dehydrogenase